MITVLRANGLSLAIYVHDHEPPHVHVIGDGRAKIRLFGRGGEPELMDVRGLKYSDVRRALLAVSENQQMLWNLWREIHGRLD